MRIPREWLPWSAQSDAGHSVPERRRRYLTLGVTAVGIPIVTWIWTQMSPGVTSSTPAPPRPAVSRAAPPPPTLALPPRPPLPTVPGSTVTTVIAPELRNPTNLPDPFDAGDGGSSLKVLERKLRMKEAELKLAQLERQIKEAREGTKPGLAPRASLSGPPVPTVPPLAPLPTLPPPSHANPAQAPSGAVTTTAPARQPSTAAPAEPPGSPPPHRSEATAAGAGPEWPTVRLVAVGRVRLAIVQRGRQVVSVGEAARLDDIVVETIAPEGVTFRHEPTGTRQFVRMPLAPEENPLAPRPVGGSERRDTPVKTSPAR